MTRSIITGLLVSAAGLAAACGGSSSPTEPSNTTPAPTLVTETFSGTVTVGGQSHHVFTVTATNYDISVHLTTAGPPVTVTMILSLGTVSEGLCVPLGNASVFAQGGSVPQLGGTINSGSYCVAVSDAGNQLADVNYTLTLYHY